MMMKRARIMMTRAIILMMRAIIMMTRAIIMMMSKCKNLSRVQENLAALAVWGQVHLHWEAENTWEMMRVRIIFQVPPPVSVKKNGQQAIIMVMTIS